MTQIIFLLTILHGICYMPHVDMADTLCALHRIGSYQTEEKIALRSAEPVRSVIARYEKFELTLDLNTNAANPFDPDQIDVQAVFTSPQGKSVTVPAFLYQPFTRKLEGGAEHLDPAGEPVWKVRFAPDTAGTWSYRLTAKDATGTATLPTSHFHVAAGDNKGFVRRSARVPSLFTFNDGQPYFPVGENMCWSGEAGTFDFDRWLVDLHRAGGDWIRLWMTENKLGIELTGGRNQPADYIGYHGLGVYSLDNAWQLDTILDTAAQNHVYVIVCMGTYGEFTTGVTSMRAPGRATPITQPTAARVKRPRSSGRTRRHGSSIGRGCAT